MQIILTCNGKDYAIQQITENEICCTIRVDTIDGLTSDWRQLSLENINGEEGFE